MVASAAAGWWANGRALVRYMQVHQKAAAAERVPGSHFNLTYPVPLMAFKTTGVAHSANKSESVQALLRGSAGLHAVHTKTTRSVRQLNATTVVLDGTPSFYTYHTVDTIGAWIQLIVLGWLDSWAAARGATRLLLILLDTGHVPQKAFIDDKRHQREAQPHEAVPTASTPMPPAADWPSWVSRKTVQAHLWQLLVAATRELLNERTDLAAAIVMDGPDAEGKPAPPVVLTNVSGKAEATVNFVDCALAG